MIDMKVRKAARKDIKQIAELMLEEFRKPPFNERDSLKAVLKSLKFYFKIGKIYVATDGNGVIGVMVFKTEQYWEGPVIIIEDLAVKERFKRQGVGKLLLTEVESYARKNKLNKILFVTHRKSQGIKFYKKFGYHPKKDVVSFEKKIR
jgi:aminoglycoside 6'-N-acetyltransferase I